MLRKALLVSSAFAAGLVAFACTASVPDAEPDIPVRVQMGVLQGPSYSQDIQPVFDEFCVECHGPEKAENGLRLDSYDGTMKGTKYGPVVIREKSSFSTLVYVLDGLVAPQIAMPFESHQLSDNRIKNIKYWIDFGALND